MAGQQQTVGAVGVLWFIGIAVFLLASNCNIQKKERREAEERRRENFARQIENAEHDERRKEWFKNREKIAIERVRSRIDKLGFSVTSTRFCGTYGGGPDPVYARYGIEYRTDDTPANKTMIEFVHVYRPR
jgi:hypothetical protein